MSRFKHYASIVITTAVTIVVIAGLAELLGVWGWIFQPYKKATGAATVE